MTINCQLCTYIFVQYKNGVKINDINNENWILLLFWKFINPVFYMFNGIYRVLSLSTMAELEELNKLIQLKEASLSETRY